jgi:DNA-binding NtrC family response regulator
VAQPTKLSANVFLELPPILSRYIETERNQWFEASPVDGSLSLLTRPGLFVDLEALAVERRHLIQALGYSRARALTFRTAFEQGRRDGARHLGLFDGNMRLALQAAPVFCQLQGRFLAEVVRCEFDLEARTLYRELLLRTCAERAAHRVAGQDGVDAGCWSSCGYLSGHTSEVLGRRVLTVAPLESAVGQNGCRLVSRFDSEWGDEAQWCRGALLAVTFEDEVAGLLQRAENAEARASEAERQAQHLVAQYAPPLTQESFCAGSEAMGRTLRRAQQAADSDVPVLLWGEEGTGKETLARAVHAAGSRRQMPFITFECGAFSEAALMEELCGRSHANGNGGRGHVGAIQRAEGGTLYLSGLSELPAEGQAVIVRLLEQHSVLLTGAHTADPADVRVMAGVTERPETLVREQGLRKDLYFGLNVLTLYLPPLRERVGDIPALVTRLLSELEARYRRTCDLDPETKQVLLESAWPGNLLQLRQVLEHALLFAEGGRIGLSDLPEEVVLDRRVSAPRALSEEVVRAALRRANGNRSEAARLLGVGRTSLWRSMRRLGISED